MGILQVLRLEFQKFRILEILDFYHAYYIVEGSGESAKMCRLARAFAAHILEVWTKMKTKTSV